MKKSTWKHLKKSIHHTVPFLVVLFVIILVWHNFSKFGGLGGQIAMPGRTYLLIFQNEAEARPTGGFISAYGVLSTGYGIPDLKIYDSYTLANYTGEAPTEVTALLDDGEWYDGHHFRDANTSPDWSISAQNLQDYYNADTSKNVNFDGIFAVNFGAVESLAHTLGYDDHLFYTLEADLRPDDAHSEVALANRKDPLKNLAKDLIFQSLMPWNWEKVTDSIRTSLDEKDIQLYFSNSDTQARARQLGWTGEMLLPDDSDYLNVNISNYGGQKSDRYIDKFIDLQSEIDSEGTVENTLTLTLRHREEETLLTGKYFAWVRIYVPAESTLLASDNDWQTVADGEFTYFSRTIELPLLSSQTYTLTYSVPEKFQNNYQLAVQKQAGTEANFSLDVRTPAQHFWSSDSAIVEENHLTYTGKLLTDLNFSGKIGTDETAPFILNQHFSDNHTLWLDTSEPLARGLVRAENFTLVDTDEIDPSTTDQLTIESVEQYDSILKITLSGMTTQPLERYTLTITNQQDLSGNAMGETTLTVIQRY